MNPPRRNFFAELRRRHVIKVMAGYAAIAYIGLEVADLVVEPLGLPGWTMRALLVAAIAGLPVTLILSWIFDITPAGLHRTSPADGGGDEAPVRLTGRVVAAGAVAFTVVATVSYVLVRPDPLAPGDALESVAVLPFVDMSPGGDQQYFSDGMTEELLDALAKVAGLRVASRTSAARFRDGGADIREVGRALNVQAVFEGSVRRDGDRLRVTAQLIDATSGYHLWSDSFDRTVMAVFEVQEQIAKEILRGLRLEHGEPEGLVRPGTDDLAAYDQYLRGNYHLARRSPRDLRRALEAYAEALRLDPDFTTAMLRQAYAYAVWVDWGWEDPPATTDELIRRAEALVERAIDREAGNPQAWLVRAYLRVVADPERMTGAPELFERAVALAPRDAESLHQYGQTLMALGQWDEARALYRRVLELEPDRAMTLVPLAAMAFYERRFDASIRWADSAVAVEPSNPYARAHRAGERSTLGSVEGALEDVGFALQAMQGHSVPVLGAAARVHAAAGDTAAALEFARQAMTEAGDRISTTEGYYLALAWWAAGRAGEALEALRRTEPKGAWLWFYLQSPAFDRLRADQEFADIVTAADPRSVEARAAGPFVSSP